MGRVVVFDAVEAGPVVPPLPAATAVGSVAAVAAVTGAAVVGVVVSAVGAGRRRRNAGGIARLGAPTGWTTVVGTAEIGVLLAADPDP